MKFAKGVGDTHFWSLRTFILKDQRVAEGGAGTDDVPLSEDLPQLMGTNLAMIRPRRGKWN